MPHHAVRHVWNDTALQKHGKETKCFVLECHAEDMIKGQPLTLAECYAALLCLQGADSKQHKQDLPNIMRIAFGMKVMVTQNVKTDLDIANGAQGTIVDIWLDLNELLLALQQPLIKLKYLPVCILMKLEWTRTSRLKDLEESVIPVKPTYKPYRISCQTNEGTIVTHTVR